MKTLVVERGAAGTDPLYLGGLAHIAATYRTVFAAETSAQPPRLALTLGRDGRIACAAGIRHHAEGFFSQHYLDEPLDEALRRRSGLPVAASGLLEVGGLACTSPFTVYPTLRAVFAWGRARGIGWGLFTATAEIRRLLQRARIAPVLLARADAGRVPDAALWGSYYDHDPWVCAFRDPEAPLLRQDTAS